MSNSEHGDQVLPSESQLPQEVPALEPEQLVELVTSASHVKAVRRKHIDFLPLKQQRELRDREEIIKDCIAFKEANNGRLPRGESATAMKKLGIKSRQTLLNLIERYETHQRMYPEDPAVNALIQLWGRPPSKALTPEQQKVALGVYLTTDWQSVLEPENEGDKPPVYAIKMLPRVDFVYAFLLEVFPDLNATKDQLWHFLERQRQSDGVLFTLARYGEKKVKMEFVPKTSNDVDAPNERWQSDGRALPLVVRDDKDPKLTFTVTQIIFLDDFSGYVPAYTLKPRKEQNHSKKMSRIGVKGEDIRLLLAKALWTTGVRPSTIYTDHGVEYEAIKPYLKYLTDDNEPPIMMVFSKPGQPWGRGKVEVIGALVDNFLRKLPGFVDDEDDLMCWRRAHASPNLLTFSQFKTQIAAYWKQWNTEAELGKKTRKQIYIESPQASLLAPSLIRLAHLGLAEEQAEVTASDNGLYYRGVYYKPKVQDKESTYRWLNAAGSTRKVPLYVLPFLDDDDVEKDLLIFACLDGKLWEEVIPVKNQRPSAKKHVENQRSSLKRKKEELGAMLGDAKAVLEKKQISKIQLRALTGAPIIHRRDVEGEHDAAVGHQPVNDQGAPLGAGSDGENNYVVKARDDHPKDVEEHPTRPSRGRRKQVDQGQASNETPPDQPPIPLSDQPATLDDDDAKVRERLRQLRAQRQQDLRS